MPMFLGCGSAAFVPGGGPTFMVTWDGDEAREGTRESL